jgi:hypothetical protein
MKRRTLILGSIGLPAMAIPGVDRAADTMVPSAVRTAPPGKGQSMYRPGQYPITFVGGTTGEWHVERLGSVVGETLPNVERIAVRTDDPSPAGGWTVRGVAGHARYVERGEKGPLDALSPPLARTEATNAALIPIRNRLSGGHYRKTNGGRFSKRTRIISPTACNTCHGLPAACTIRATWASPSISSRGSSSRPNTRRPSTICWACCDPARSGASSNARWRFAWCADAPGGFRRSNGRRRVGQGPSDCRLRSLASVQLFERRRYVCRL